jgi:hypothetical protein
MTDRGLTQLRAEEIALDKYGLEFYELTDAQQSEVYSQAYEDSINIQAARADFLLDSLRERDLL